MDDRKAYRKNNLPPNAEKVFSGIIYNVYQWEQELYDGSTATFEKITRPDTVVIFPVLPDKTILLTKDTQPGRETVLTAPSGRVDPGETLEEAAWRELLEETGYKPETLIEFYTATQGRKGEGKIDHSVYIFIGKNCEKIVEPELEAGEKIELLPVTFDELVELAVSGELSGGDFTEIVLRAKLSPEKMNKLRAKFLD